MEGIFGGGGAGGASGMLFGLSGDVGVTDEGEVGTL